MSLCESSSLSSLSSSQFQELEFSPPPSNQPQPDPLSSPHPPSPDVSHNTHSPSSLVQPSKHKHRSRVWEYGVEVVFEGRECWECNICHMHYARISLGNAARHLHKAHRIDIKNKTTEAELMHESQQIVQDMFGQASEPGVRHQPVHFNREIFKELLIRLVSRRDVPLWAVELEEFRDLLHYCCSVESNLTAVPSTLPRSGNTIRSWIIAYYEDQKGYLQEKLSKARSALHTSFDLWSSGNMKAYLGLVGHWISEQGVKFSTMLGLRRLVGGHTGENQAALVWDVMWEFGMERKYGYSTLDNASNNTTALRAISRELRHLGIVWNPEEHYVHCLGHVINLVVKAFLYGTREEDAIIQATQEEDLASDINFNDCTTFSEGSQIPVETCSRETLAREKCKQEEWRKRGPVGRLRNVITAIKWTPQRRDEFQGCVSALHLPATKAHKLISPNDTRWNGDYQAILRALSLRDAVDTFVTGHLDDETTIPGLEKDILTPEDWVQLAEMSEILSPFEIYTRELQGKREFGALYDVFRVYDRLLAHLEERKIFYRHATDGPRDTQLIAALNSAWAVLDKYYNIADQCPMLHAAVVLHPARKMEYFKHEWGDRPSWLRLVQTKVERLWQQQYKDRKPQVVEATPDEDRRSESPSETSFLEWSAHPPALKRRRLGCESGLDELQQYLSLPVEDIQDKNYLEWWKAQETEFPNLSTMAFDAAAIAAMSAEAERVFSRYTTCYFGIDLSTAYRYSTGYQLSDRRRKLGDEIVEAQEFLKSLMRNGLLHFEQAAAVLRMLEAAANLEQSERQAHC